MGILGDDMRKAMVVFSGGQDSTVCLYWAKKHFDEVHAISFDYGQKHAIEIEAANIIATQANIASYKIINVKEVLASRSPLISKDVMLESYKNKAEMDSIIGNRLEFTFVPMRNSLFFTIAANQALAIDSYDIVSGVCQEDNANYPDCTKSFVQAQQRAINEALGINEFKIHTPLIYAKKSDIVAMAIELSALDALAYSHTCYAGTFPPCSVCHSCVLRADGFEKAGITDPLIERANDIK